MIESQQAEVLDLKTTLRVSAEDKMIALLIVLGFLAIWAFLIVLIGYTQVETGEIATVKRLGEFMGRVLGPGPHFVIPFVDQVEKHSTMTYEDEFPADPEMVEKANEDTVSVGKKAPYRIVQSGAKTAIYYVETKNPSGPNTWDTVPFGDKAISKETWDAKENDSLEESITSEVQVVVEWDNDRASIGNYINNVGSRAVVLKRMEDMVPKLLQELLGPITAGHSRDVMSHLSSLIQERLKIFVGQTDDPATGTKHDKPWGINIRNAYIKSIDPGKTVNVARAKASAAVAEKQATIEEAEGKKRTIELNADAKAYEERQTGTARADAFKSMADVLETPGGQRAAQIEAAKEVLASSRTIVVPSDIGGIIPSLSIMASELTKPMK